MYICLCNGLNEKTVRKAARQCEGSKNAIQIYETLGVKPQCGVCLCEAQTVVEQERQAAQAS